MSLELRKDDARPLQYALRMGKREVRETAPDPNTVMRNVASLMKWHGWKQPELARRSGVSQRHISDLLRGMSDCTTEMAEKLAGAFGVPSWELMLDQITPEILTNSELQIIVETYIKNPKGRKLIRGAVDMVRDTRESLKP